MEPLTPEQLDRRDAMWADANAAVEAGSFDREAWKKFLLDLREVVGDNPRLEGVVQMGLDLGFITDAGEAEVLLGRPAPEDE